MIEVGAAEVDEATMLRAIRVGYDEGIKPTLELIEELRAKCGAPAVRMGELTTPSDEITKKVKELAYDRLVVARKINGKKERNEAVDAIKGEILKAHFSIDRITSGVATVRKTPCEIHRTRDILDIQDTFTKSPVPALATRVR